MCRKSYCDDNVKLQSVAISCNQISTIITLLAAKLNSTFEATLQKISFNKLDIWTDYSHGLLSDSDCFAKDIESINIGP